MEIVRTGEMSGGNVLYSDFQFYYRATRMHSADYAVTRCLSVRQTPVLCVNGYRPTYPQSFFTVG